MVESHKSKKEDNLPAEATHHTTLPRDRLLQASRWVAVGKLSRSIVHQLNSHLTGILTYAHFLLAEIPETDPKREYAETILKETDRCREVIARFQEFARGGISETFMVNLNEVLEQLLLLLEHKATTQSVKLVRKLQKGLPHPAVDVAEVKEAFWNLMTNDLEAMPKGGSLTIETKMDKVNDILVIEFTDSGSGIPQEDMAHLFEPFYTTRDQQAGLGLYYTYWIIKKWGGTIEVKSKHGQGTTFIVKLPHGDKAKVG